MTMELAQPCCACLFKKEFIKAIHSQVKEALSHSRLLRHTPSLPACFFGIVKGTKHSGCLVFLYQS